MSKTHKITVNYRQIGKTETFTVPEDEYILKSLEQQGFKIPFSCRNGACTTCAVRVKSGDLEQKYAMGLSPDLQRRGYALMCVSHAKSDLVVETQDEDEVYELQFGRNFGRGKVRFGLPLDEE